MKKKSKIQLQQKKKIEKDKQVTQTKIPNFYEKVESDQMMNHYIKVENDDEERKKKCYE